MQSPSFLEVQRRMPYERSANNAATLFGVDQSSSNQPIRHLLDFIAPESVCRGAV